MVDGRDAEKSPPKDMMAQENSGEGADEKSSQPSHVS